MERDGKQGKKKRILCFSRVSELGPVLFLLSIIVTHFYFQQMLFSCSKSQYSEIQGKAATWLPKLLR